jgi:hypothetical protein
MSFRLPGALVCAAASSVLVLGLSACGGGDDGGSGTSASDAATGLTVTVANDQVKLKRSAKSTSGTGGTSGTVSCTDDYAKLAKASAVPPPTESWYATTLITWPQTAKESTARLSHPLKGDPQLCVVQTADSSASAVIYFSTKIKTAVTKLQTDSSRTQQAGQASAALKAAAQAAVGTVSKGAFPDANTVVASITAQGLYAKATADVSGATEAGTVYVVSDKTTKSTLVLAVKDSKGVVNTATQGVKGSPKLATVKG